MGTVRVSANFLPDCWQETHWSDRLEACKRLGLGDLIIVPLDLLNELLKATPAERKKKAREYRAANKRLIDRAMSILGPFLKKNTRVLEIGPGPGDLMLKLLPRVDYQAIELCAPLVEFARKRAIKKLGDMGKKEWRRIAKGSVLTLEDVEWFDIVILGRVGLHITDDLSWDDALCRIARATRKGGLFFLYEAMSDFNKRIPRSAKFRLFRLYMDRLEQLGFEFVSAENEDYLNEVDTFALFEKSGS